jgi:hypothetical protein
MAMLGSAVIGAAASGAVSAPRSSVRTGLWSCANRVVVKPANFTITCADGYTLLSATHWTTWTAIRAAGTTTFGENFCTPDCAASKITDFPKSTVVLSAPEKTAHGTLFSRLVVRYVLHGAHKTFSFSWSGDPSFKS